MADAPVLDPLVRAAREGLVAAGMERVQENGLVWFRGGAGQTRLVLIHGVNDQAGTWAAVVPALLQRFRLIAVDLAGHGESEPYAGPLRMPVILEGLEHVLEREGADHVTLVGNSMGGWVSMLHALAHPGRVERLVLEDSGGMSWNITAPLLPTTREEARASIQAVTGSDAFVPDFILDAFVGRSTTSQMARVTATDVQDFVVDDRFSELQMPVDLIWGAADGVLPLDYARQMQRGIAGSRLHVLDGAAHIPHMQKPESFVACLTSIF